MPDADLLHLLVASLIAPAVTEWAKRYQWARDLSRQLCVALGGLTGIILFWLVGAGGSVKGGLVLGLAAGGLATGAVNTAKEARKRMKARPARPQKLGPRKG